MRKRSENEEKKGNGGEKPHSGSILSGKIGDFQPGKTALLIKKKGS